MPAPDTAGAIQDALVAAWSSEHPAWSVVLEVDDNYEPEIGKPVLLVADDGSTPVHRGAWMVRKTPRRPMIRLTGFAAGRTEALAVVNAAADFVLAHKPGISRVEDVSDPLVTKDRATGAVLASITMPVIVKPTS
ncbi:hypothetical protein KL864_27040 [Mycolicibacterium goodii]|uniref:hypothetical protein n=1 Tax=Mycolicibacterium goodii TaxID=134601 RepID=UPI001BDD171D|nr:hypothetical protein [Mycolicibacterium goodii]MBU8819546.1 hypothetical protein [Mycolicibacterium goodii]